MDEQPRSTLRRPSRLPWVILAFALVGAAALLVVWRRMGPTLEPPAPAAADAGPAAPADAGPVPPVDPARLRALLEAVSPHALFRRALAAGDLVRRWVVVTDNLAEGVSPRAQLPFLAPAQPFTVERRAGATVIAPASYQRYDEFAAAVASVNAPALGRAYRELHPVLEAAYRALGYPGASLDTVTTRALRRIEGAPVAEGEVRLEAKGGNYLFADPRLEELPGVEKHLLRMGPKNTRLLQAKARELREALGLGGG